MEKKYELTDETVEIDGHTLYRIKALKNFGDVKKGDLGGFIETESNLSHTGDCWVYDNASVFDDAWVRGNAMAYDNAKVFDDTLVCGNAKVHDYAKVFGNAKVFNDARVCDNANVCSDSKICGDADISSNDDYLVVSPIGSRRDTTTFFRCKDESIKVTCGCFFGTIDEFKDKVIETHGDNRYGKEYMLAIEMAKLKNSKGE